MSIKTALHVKILKAELFFRKLMLLRLLEKEAVKKCAQEKDDLWVN